MTDVWITEYKGPVIFNGIGVPVGQEPAVANQVVTFGAGSQPSADMNAETKFVRIVSDGNMHFKVGSTNVEVPVATTSDTKLNAGVVEYFGIPPGHQIAFIDGV